MKDLPFNNVDKLETDEREITISNINAMNSKSIEDYNSRYDRSILTSIDPDINVPLNVNSLYYNENTFNTKCQGTCNDKLSFIHINIRSAPKNLKKFELFLQNLKCDFPIICCSETFFKDASKVRHTPKGFDHVYDFRPKKNRFLSQV